MSGISIFSIVIPVYNEELNLRNLIDAILPVARETGKGYEIIFVDDGSSDGSLSIMKDMLKSPEIIIIELEANVGQHAAVLAGFSISRGDAVITMDADLQNPPDEIPRLLSAMEAGGYDVVGTIRRNRKDSIFRVAASKIVNSSVKKITGHQMSDWGCMMRAYRRDVVDAMVADRRAPVFIPLLSCGFAENMTEIEIEHQSRLHGKSHYSVMGLVKLLFVFVLSIKNSRSKPPEFFSKIDHDRPLFVIKEIHSFKAGVKK